jgi:hypothetical protein
MDNFKLYVLINDKHCINGWYTNGFDWDDACSCSSFFKKYGCKTNIIRYYPTIIDDRHPDSHNYDTKCEYNIINNKIIFL